MKQPKTEIQKRYTGTVKGRYTKYKECAKSRNHSFELTLEEFTSFWQIPCSYCGGEISTIGIDRIDSSVGYVFTNCRTACWFCNSMKLDHTIEEWQDQMYRILKHQGVI
jgi:hypothetical protein